ncbi:MAG: glycosyltransferase family 2 protein [Burkholderiales bacterium]|nr:glycosyltransferase family 2 protein [Burkholderiales bacterium]
MNNQIILTIGIPTYNGANYIANTINSILQEVEKNNLTNLEIVISDNCSTDNTQDVVSQFINIPHLKIHYYKNSTNIGFDRNIDNVIKLATGRYVWTLADDDYIINDGVTKVIKFLSINGVELLFVNYSNAININPNNTLYSNSNDFFRNIKFKNGLISSNIINRETWLTLDMARYFDSSWIHVAYSIEALNPNKTSMAGIIVDNVLQMDGVPRWGENGSFIYTGFKLLDIFKRIPELNYDNDIKKLADFVIKGGYPKNLIIAKSQGFIVNNLVISRFKHYYRNYLSFWLIDLPILYLPKQLCTLFIKLNKFFKKLF